MLSQLFFLVPQTTLLQHLSEPDLIAASDGSYHERANTGSYAWILSTRTGIRLAQCSGHVTAHRGSSYRSEAYAVLSFHVFLHILSNYLPFHVRVSTLYSDSKAAVDTIITWNSWKPRGTL